MDLTILVRLIFQLSWSFILVFIYCDFGGKVSNEFNDIYEVVCSLDWHSFPIEIQKMMPNIIIAVQKPVLVRGFGNISCTRTVFQKVSLKN